MKSSILEGFLTGRAEDAWSRACTTETAKAARAWIKAATAFQQALDEYLKNGDSQAVKDLTAVAMDAGDEAIKEAK